MTFIDEIKKIERGQLKPIYLLYGTDYYIREELIQSINKAFEKKYKDIEKFIFYGTDKKDHDFIESLSSMGLFSSKKIVIYKGIEKLTTKAKNQFIKYLEKPDQNIVLVVTYEGTKNKFFKTLDQLSQTISCWKPYPKQYTGIVKMQINKMGFEITPPALELLVHETDDTFSHTFSEFEKIVVSLENRKKIEIQDVKSVVGGTRNYQMSDFINSVKNKNLFDAVKICIALKDSGAKVPFFIVVLYNFFINSWAYYEVHSQSANNYWAKTRTKEWEQGSANYRGSDYSFIFQRLREADYRSKSTNLSVEEIMIPLIYEIIKI